MGCLLVYFVDGEHNLIACMEQARGSHCAEAGILNDIRALCRVLYATELKVIQIILVLGENIPQQLW